MRARRTAAKALGVVGVALVAGAHQPARQPAQPARDSAGGFVAHREHIQPGAVRPLLCGYRLRTVANPRARSSPNR